jgi:hypothetical protein
MKFKYKTNLSEYDLKNIIWVGIEYDKEKLIKFFEKYHTLKTKKDKDSIEELRIMNDILDSHDLDNLNKLLNNNFEYSRWATIESLSRKASIEILLDGKYSKETFEIISNLPVSDFKLVIKRTKELIGLINDVITDVDLDSTKIPGVK